MRTGNVPDAFDPVPSGCDLRAPRPGIVLQVNPRTYAAQWIGGPLGGTSDAVSLIARFNADAAAYLARFGPDSIAAARAALLSQHADAAEGVAGDAPTIYAMADRLAEHFRRRVDRAITCVVSIVMAAAICYVADAEFGKSPAPIVPPAGLRLLALLHVVTIGGICAVVWAVRGWEIEARFLDYRALAEGLRVLVFWKVAGVRRSVSATYLAKHAGVLDWIPRAIDNVETLSDRSDEGTNALAAAAGPLWVERQAD